MPRWIVALIFLVVPALAGAQTGLVKAEKNLTLRAEPKPKAKAVEQLLRFQPVKILERRDNWAKVKTVKIDPSQSKEGWVVASLISDTAFVTVDSDVLSARVKPGPRETAVVTYNKTYPVFVRDVAPNGWVLVLDVDGDGGWVAPSGLAFKPRYVITKSPQSNLRTGGGKDYEKFPVAFVAERGVYLQVLEEKDGWLHVKHEGGQEGWISTKIVFGWNDEERAKPKTEAAKKPAKPAKTSAAKKNSDSSAKTSSAKSTKSTSKKPARTTRKKAG
ncbi:SH3 domain-containing protein [bacterium]|nr:SH3 domain-containing protein [bacterium]